MGDVVLFERLHHHAFTFPQGQEPLIRSFYAGVLGMTEVPKPSTMRKVGAWFRTDGVELHFVPVEEFTPNAWGHPAIVVSNLDRLAALLAENNVLVEPDDRFPGHRRFHTYDFFGNQIEFLEPLQEQQ